MRDCRPWPEVSRCSVELPLEGVVFAGAFTDIADAVGNIGSEEDHRSRAHLVRFAVDHFFDLPIADDDDFVFDMGVLIVTTSMGIKGVWQLITS